MAELVTAVIVAVLGSSWLGSVILNRTGKSSNKAILDRLESVSAVVDELKAKADQTAVGMHKMAIQIEEHEATRIRVRILSFNGEILRGQLHTREDFIDILDEIGTYEEYCRTHTSYHNNRANFAIENIKRIYKECMEKGTFLED